MGVCLLKNALEVIHPVIVANSDENTSRPNLDCFIGNVRAHVEIELLESVLFLFSAHTFGDREDREQDERERHAGNGGDPL